MQSSKIHWENHKSKKCTTSILWRSWHRRVHWELILPSQEICGLCMSPLILVTIISFPARAYLFLQQSIGFPNVFLAFEWRPHKMLKTTNNCYQNQSKHRHSKHTYFMTWHYQLPVDPPLPRPPHLFSCFCCSFLRGLAILHDNYVFSLCFLGVFSPSPVPLQSSPNPVQSQCRPAPVQSSPALVQSRFSPLPAESIPSPSPVQVQSSHISAQSSPIPIQFSPVHLLAFSSPEQQEQETIVCGLGLNGCQLAGVLRDESLSQLINFPVGSHCFPKGAFIPNEWMRVSCIRKPSI